MKQKVISVFKDLYKSEPSVFRSPGRINIIGEHTDYNAGFVLPAAINKEMYFAIAPNTCNSFRFYAYDLQESSEISSSDIQIQTLKTWTNYLLGVVAQIKKRGISIPTVDVVIGSTIPVGAGISSSAAMECGFLFALNSLFSFQFSTIEMVQMAQMAEHEYAGVKCGIMDQFAVMHGKENHVIKLDCRSLEFSYSPLQLNDYTILLCDTAVKHSLASSEYNLRRAECEKGVSVISQHYNNNNINSLRDVSLEQLNHCAHLLSTLTIDRCSYVIEENIRLEKTCKAMDSNDLKTVGEMIFASHEGLKNKYEVSCKELDVLVDIARSTSGVLGARMMGGGFGGCTINIVHNDIVADFKQRVQKEYYLAYNKPENIIEVAICNGTCKCE
jgi:galactokinase